MPNTATQLASPSHHGSEDFEDELQGLMEQFTKNPEVDPLKQAQTDIDNVRTKMADNISGILARGDRLDGLLDRSDAMAAQAHAFRRGARGKQIACEMDY